MFKTNLISSEWPTYIKKNKFNKNHENINQIIEFISNIRSTKAELKITPKLFSDIYFLEKSSKLNVVVKKHLALVKHVGRINNILSQKEDNRSAIEIISLNEKISLKFSEDIDFASQKLSILQKLSNLEKQTNSLRNKLNNKAYLKNAPKEIIQNDKKLLEELTIEDEKLRSIVSSIN